MNLKEFNKLPDGKIFDSGILPNSPEGIFMSLNGGNLRWIAVKGDYGDWAIYCDWSYYQEPWIKKHGQKMHDINHIQRCVPCDEEVMDRYRF